MHRDLADAAARTEKVVANVDLTNIKHFVAKRAAIRAAPAGDSVVSEIEAPVGASLPP